MPPEAPGSLYDQLSDEERHFHDALVGVTQRFGKFHSTSSVWVGYVGPEENDNLEIGVKCGNCSFWQGDGNCQIVDLKVEEGGYCRLAAIPDGVVRKQKMDNESIGGEIVEYMRMASEE